MGNMWGVKTKANLFRMCWFRAMSIPGSSTSSRILHVILSLKYWVWWDESMRVKAFSIGVCYSPQYFLFPWCRIDILAWSVFGWWDSKPRQWVWVTGSPFPPPSITGSAHFHVLLTSNIFCPTREILHRSPHSPMSLQNTLLKTPVHLHLVHLDPSVPKRLQYLSKVKC